MCARDVLPNFVGGMRSMRAEKKKTAQAVYTRAEKNWIQHLDTTSKFFGAIKTALNAMLP